MAIIMSTYSWNGTKEFVSTLKPSFMACANMGAQRGAAQALKRLWVMQLIFHSNRRSAPPVFLLPFWAYLFSAMTKPPIVLLSYDWRLFLSMSIFDGPGHETLVFLHFLTGKIVRKYRK